MDFHNSMRMVYAKDSPYFQMANDICESQLNYVNHYEEFVGRINDINNMMGDWLQGFTNARVCNNTYYI